MTSTPHSWDGYLAGMGCGFRLNEGDGHLLRDGKPLPLVRLEFEDLPLW